MSITTALKVADYFIHFANKNDGYLYNIKLQKLLYYSQAWHLAMYHLPLFKEDFEAWAVAPVIPSVYEKYQHLGWKHISKNTKKPKFHQEKNEFLENIIDEYFIYDPFEIDKKKDCEEPWTLARGNLPCDESSHTIIPKLSMKDYFQKRVFK